MDFDSPDVAKEFPGLARALTDVNEYEDWDKSKKKKEKKDSKKDKDKGYAALNDSPDEEEAEAKSPGKSIKIKAFKLTSKKKEKDKEKKEITQLPPSVIVPLKLNEKQRAKSLCGELETKASPDREDHRSHGPTSVAAEPIPHTQQRRPFDGQGYKHSIGAVSLKSSKKLKQSPSNSSGNNTGSDDPNGLATSSTERKGLNVFLNAPVPLLSKKKEQKEKDCKKEEGSSSSKGKLKLKKISKTSFEEPSTIGRDSNQPGPNSHLPEDPEQISKEIKRYEAMLEQAHAQVKSGKKVSKKTEDQLWELQMTLTQLKRKLRSINALSASFPSSLSATVSSTSTATKSTSPLAAAIESDPLPHGEPKRNPTDIGERPSPSAKAATCQNVAPAYVIQEKIPSEEFPSMPLSESLKISDSNSHIDGIEISKSVPTQEKEILSLETVAITTESAPVVTTSVVGQLERLSDIELDRRDTIQVKVEVHAKETSCNENPTPEDIYEQEITSFNEAETGIEVTEAGKRENIEKGRQLLHIPATPDSSKSKSEELSSAVEENLTTIDSEAPRNETDADEGDYVFLKPCTSSTYQNDFEEEKSQSQQLSQLKKVVSAPSIFDPFALPEFKTDEFIAAENEALILFTQQLQDEIVKEEEQIEQLIRQIQEVNIESRRSTWSDLEELDDDELVNLWQAVKLENDTLNEQVLNLKLMVANSRLEEFRLETRVKYLQSKAQTGTGQCEPSKISVS